MPISSLSRALCAGAAAWFLHAAALAAPGATFISQSVPNTMQLGKTYSVSVTYKNTGDTTWTGASQYRLGAVNPIDNRRWGTGRVELPAGVAVPPNGLYTFTFDVAITDSRYCRPSPRPQLQNCDFQWGLLQESVAWLSLGVNTQVELFDAPDLRSAVPPIAPPVAVDAAAFNAASFRGANVLMQTYEDNRLCDHTAWLPDAEQADAIIGNAVAMGLNVLRMPVILPPRNPGRPADWIPNSPEYRHVCADPDKPEWGEQGDRALLNQQVIAKVQVIMDKAAAAQLKVILVLDGYTKYDAPCYWKKSFLDVRDSADSFIKAFKSHQALLAWDILNEPMWNALAFDCLHRNEDYASVLQAVDSMYNLVRSQDALHPTTVGEHQIPLLKYWKDISSFASPHLYVATNSRDPESRNQINYVQAASLREMSRELGAAMPLVIGEFGSPDPDDDFNAAYYQLFLNGLTVADRGFILWSLSSGVNQQGFSVMRPDGELKPAALLVQRRVWYPVVQQLYLAYLGYPADPGALENFSAQLATLAEDMRYRGQILQPSVAALDAAYATEPSLRTLLDSLYASSSFHEIYNPDQPADYVRQIYRQLFNRAPDDDGLRYWTDNISYYGVGKDRAVAAILAGGLSGSSDQGRLDAAAIGKKAALASAFSASLNTPERRDCYAGNLAVATGRALMTPVDASTDLGLQRGRLDSAVDTLCGR
ncbi:cellulase family glycosylhydrolase [Duganella sp. FT80W]|uniref:Cellulase family glycosylhydrolase n=1 Tax=Duganella guangzhouensis TaxID=2666084 RepID=A0A6I2KVP7_9BURK|nr:cellulase family glycosylhydrolase [Duganella guangzhouensis]MRW90145.1 cellulase family glycosylhydrolase [Duganella guangzhouensis]